MTHAHPNPHEAPPPEGDVRLILEPCELGRMAPIRLIHS